MLLDFYALHVYQYAPCGLHGEKYTILNAWCPWCNLVPNFGLQIYVLEYTCSSTFSEKKIWIQLLIFKHCCIIFFGKHNLPRPCISLAMQMYFPFYAPVVTCYDGCRQKPLLPSFESAEMRNLAETLLRYTVSKIFAWHHSCGTLYCCYYNFLVQCLQGYNSWESRC